ncbi:MAG: hypothetical protein QNJ63_18545 [Calothrix sp. MO_192.B10]|nr:hypothetical protein [Calothrix sp. MO_192.B10]
MLKINALKTLPITITTILGITLLGTQYQAAAIDNRQSNPDKLQPVRIDYTNQQLNKDNLFANNRDYWWGPKRDFRIWMPGYITLNKHDKLMSKGSNNTAYIIMHRDIDGMARIPKPWIPRFLNRTMRKTIANHGKVIRSRNLAMGSHPGLELMIQHYDGTLGQYQAFVVKRRVYVIGARTKNELTSESVNFFNSFQVYPQRVYY